MATCDEPTRGPRPLQPPLELTKGATYSHAALRGVCTAFVRYFFVLRSVLDAVSVLDADAK